MTRIIAVLFDLAYKMQTHYLFSVSLRNWLWGLFILPPLAALLGRLSWLHVIWIALLGVLLLAAVEWARRRGYLVFVPTQVGTGEAASQPPAIDEYVTCRASGLFAVAGNQRYIVGEPAQITYVSTREHIVMARLKRTRFLLLARSLAGEAGWWYVFFLPHHVQQVRAGHVFHGLRPRPALAIRYRCAERDGREETVYLACATIEDLERIRSDLQIDVSPSAFAG